MGVRENKVETELDDQVHQRGGLTRKWVSPGRDGVPDRLVVLPTTAEAMIERLTKLPPGTTVADIIAVEVKTDDGELTAVQAREQYRLINAGLRSLTVYGVGGVRRFMESIDEQ